MQTKGHKTPRLKEKLLCHSWRDTGTFCDDHRLGKLSLVHDTCIWLNCCIYDNSDFEVGLFQYSKCLSRAEMLHFSWKTCNLSSSELCRKPSYNAVVYQLLIGSYRAKQWHSKNILVQNKRWEFVYIHVEASSQRRRELMPINSSTLYCDSEKWWANSCLWSLVRPPAVFMFVCLLSLC